VEDTAFFRYGRLLSRNDVGFTPGIFAFSKAEFDASIAKRSVDFPNSLLATATHDHKRGEDVRARLAVLSEIAEEWQREVKTWFDLNSPLRSPAIEGGGEYKLYQTLLGTWPMDFTPEDPRLNDYSARILPWREKSMREAKLSTSWTEPNADFERANMEFARAILDPARSAAFLNRLSTFVARLAPAGALNALTQCSLRCTLPGVPDLYQGAEFWDLSLVDPDNRRPVDYAARMKALTDAGSPADLLRHWRDGHLKQWLIARLLALRAREPDCFEGGTYEPVQATGPRENHVIAFLRRHRDKAIFVALPRLCASACIEAGAPLPAHEFWEGTQLELPIAARPWRSALNQDVSYHSRASFACAELFAHFPAAVLH